MAHWVAKIVMPIGAMQGEAAAVIHRVWDIGQIVVLAGHACAAIFGVNAEGARAGRMRPHPAGDGAAHHGLAVLPRR